MTDQDTLIVIRDVRKPGWFSVDNEFIRNGYAAEIGAQGVATYLAILAHVDRKTQQCWPRYRKLQELTGLSRTTIQKETAKLAAWGLIHIEPRVNKRGRTSHLYTVTDKSVWRREAVIKQGKGVFVTRTLGRPSDIAEDSQEEAPSGQDDDEGIAPNGSRDARLAVREVDGGSTSSEPGFVQEAHLPRSQGAPKQHSGSNTQKERNPSHHHQGRDDDDDWVPAFSEAEWVVEHREPISSERLQIKRWLVQTLLPVVVPEFHGPKRFVEKLEASQVDRLGVCLMWLSHMNEYGRGLRNRAGFVHFVVNDNEWEHSEDFEEMQYLWVDFCWHIVEILKGSVTARQSKNWLVENHLSSDLAFELALAGLTFQAEEMPPCRDEAPLDVVDTLTDWDEDPPF